MKEKLIIADDNLEFSTSLFNYLKANNNFIDVIGIAENGQKAIDLIEQLNPDIILLDLKMPQKNGIELLQYLNAKNIIVIIISGEINMINQINIFDFKVVQQIYLKPFDFSALNIDLINIYQENLVREKRKNIEDELSCFNFNKNSKGYKYLIDCLDFCSTDPKLLINMENELFLKVSKKNNIKNNKEIKWSVQKTLISMERYTETGTILRYFPYSSKPTLKTFISRMSEIITKKY